MVLKLLPLIAIAAVILGIVAVATGSAGVVSNALPSSGKKIVSCDVTVNNQAGKAPAIDNYICQRQNNCLGVFSFANVMPQFLIPKDVVFLQSVAEDGAKSGTVKLEITEQTLSNTAKTAELNVCTASTTGSIKLLDKSSQLLQAKEWTVS